MNRVGEHPVPGGPLAVRWLGYDLGDVRAGALNDATVVLENAGAATWRHGAESRIELSYHWRDDLGNAIVWGGLWKPLGRDVAPGERVETTLQLRAPMPPGRYRLTFDLVDEGRVWFSQVGNVELAVDVEVLPRLERRALAVLVGDTPEDPAARTREALATQEEPLVEPGEELAAAHLAPGCLPPPDWSRRVLDAHDEGYAVVSGSVDPLDGRLGRRRAAAALRAWGPGTGRIPNFEHPLLCPSMIHGAEPSWTWLDPIAGLPTIAQPPNEPWVYDGRIRMPVEVAALRL